jgi:hydrogenase maturation protein HypF
MAIAYLCDAFSGRNAEKSNINKDERDSDSRDIRIGDRSTSWSHKRIRAKKILTAQIEESKSLKRVSKKKRNAVIEMIERDLNSPMASSCGRLFDAVSFLVGLAPREMEFEAEAPMRLESGADELIRKSYRFAIIDDKKRGQATFYRGNKKSSLSPFLSQSFHISFIPTIKAIMEDLNQGIPVSHIAAKFHNTLARVIIRVAERARQRHQIDTVALTGGVFLNKRLLTTALNLLEHKGFKTLRPVVYSPNDESISVGQIAYALNFIHSDFNTAHEE